jgi:sulfonate transport system permease protein
VVDPTLPLGRNMPSLAWVPFLLLCMGIGEAPKITLIATGAVFPVYQNLVTGIRELARRRVHLMEALHVAGVPSSAAPRVPPRAISAGSS